MDDVCVIDNFFDLGGHSLLAMRVVARLEKETGVRINPGELILQTLGQVAAACERTVAENGPPGEAPTNETSPAHSGKLKDWTSRLLRRNQPERD